jgi:hypothetical protein
MLGVSLQIIWPILWCEKLQAPQLFFGVSNPAPVNSETFCDMARRENRAAIRTGKNFGQP